MKRFTFFSLMTLALPFTAMGQNQIVDDVYFNPGNPQTIQTQKTNQIQQTINSRQRPNYKNGAQEIVYKERNVKNPSIIRDTVYVVGQASDYNVNHNNNDFNPSKWDGKTNPVILHDTIYVAENLNSSTDNNQDISNNQEQGYYVNGFNGTESDKEYAERIRRFHNPKYSIFVGDPRYNDVFFLNSSDWNVYVDDSYAYVTPTWTNPYWWNYEYGSMGFGSFGFGWRSPYYGFGGMYDTFGYGSFYGYGGMYGYGNYWNPYGYGYGGYYGNYGNYYGYGGNWNGFANINKNYNEANRRSTANYNNNGSTRLGGTRTDGSNSTVIAGGNYSGQSRNQYTVVSGIRPSASNGIANRSTLNSTSRTVTNQANGIGIVRNTTTRGITSYQNTNTGNSISRTSNSSVNTRPRTYSTTVTSVPTGNNLSRGDNSGNSSFRGSSSTITRSTTSSGSSTIAPSRGNYYSTGGSSNVSRSSSPSYSTGGSSRSSSSSGSSSGGGGGRSSSGGSTGGGRR